jgi:arylsulfatase A-like enzyme
MTSTTTPADRVATPLDPGGRPKTARRLGPVDVLMLSAWCGLAAGWLEVATRVLLKSIIVTDRMHQMSRHFVWAAPISNLLVFSVAGLFLAAGARLSSRRAGWLAPRFICAAAITPVFMVAVPQVYTLAWLFLASGIAMRVVPMLEREAAGWRWWLIATFPGLLALVPVVAGFVFAGDWLKESREARRSLPPEGAPNVLLIVLDTVRADNLSLYGYPRATTPVLDQLAKRGVLFEEARSTAPWTLASHASMFTGRLPHELGVRWKTSLRDKFPTLAEYLGAHGYATAGFVANTQYCSYDTGLDRGFTHYEDYPTDIKHLRPLRTAVLFDALFDVISKLCLRLSPTRYGVILRWFLSPERKDAKAINSEFMDWLSRRQGERRPFFAFLNYYDAHSPYLPPEGTRFRFGTGPRDVTDFLVLVELWKTIDKLKLTQHFIDLIQDSYDNCLAYLDARLGQLFADLQRRGLLEKTVVIITADHGEELGDHTLFEHGESLYRPEVRVPLLFLLPSGEHSPGVVRDTVSLRHLPATIVDLVGLGAKSPFPGRSLARLWRDPARAATPGDPDLADAVISELAEPSPTNPSLGRSPATRGPLISIAEENYVYIRNEGDGTEELFNERLDPAELVNLIDSEAKQPLILRLRQSVDKLKTRRPGTAP